MYSRWSSPSLHHRAAHNRSGITYSWSIFPGIKEEWNESSGRRRGGHFGGRGKGRNRCCEEGRREKEVETERERRGRGRRRGRRRARAPHHGGKHSATVIARPRPYLLFTWLPALCTRTTIPFQRLEPLETLARTRIALYVVDLLAAAFYFSLSLLYAASRFHSPSLSFFPCFSLFISFWKRKRGKGEPSLGTNKA